MSPIKLILFGPPRLERDGQQVEINRRKALAILVYLAVTAQPHRRDSLATLFWPELSQSQARGNLRRTLSELHREAGEGVLLLEGEIVAVAGDKLWCDVARFRDCLSSCSTHGHSPDNSCSNCISLLEEAVGLYQAGFLAGFTLRDSVQFDDWQYFEAETLRQQFAAALERLVQAFDQKGNFEAAILYARRWLSLDPLHEPAQYRLIRLYHRSGQSSAAIRQYELYVQLLEKEIGVEPTAEITALYEEIKANRKSVGHPIHTQSQIVPKPVKGLPAQTTSFLGRERELSELTQLLATKPDCRLITLVGPGGIGKTRLSIEAAVRAGNSFRDGMAFVPLASVNGRELIVPAIAEAIQFKFQGEAEPREQILRHLRQRNTLLILDNFEQLLPVGGEELISALLEHAPQLKLIVTSRERLHLQEEWVLDVQGMAFPPEVPVPGSGVDELENYPAIKLFAERAQKARTQFVMTADDLKAVIHICQLVGGMPLGIELAAPWVRSMSCQEIADAIEHSFDLLETSLRNVPGRHRSMRTVLEQTWEQLTTAEQDVLKKLSVFQGGCSRQAAETAAGASLALLSSLVDKALVRHADKRYALHELIRQFAFEQLQKSPELYTQAQKDHYQYYSAFLERQVEGLKGGPQLETVNAITADINNIRAAWQEAVNLQDLEAIERCAESLFLYSEMSGRLAEAESAFQRATAALADPMGPAYGGAPRESFENVLGNLLVLQGVLALHTGKRNGLELAKRGVSLVRRYKEEQTRQSRYREAFCLMWLGWASFLPGLYHNSETYLEEACSIFAEMGERWGIAKCLFMLSNADIARGRLLKAEKALRKSLSLSREIGDSRSRIMINRTLGIVTLWFGDLPLTQQLLEEAVLLSQEFNDLLGLENTLRELGKLQTARGDLQLAAQTLLQSIDICHEIGAHWEGELAYCDLGDLYRVQGDYRAAEQALQRGLEAALATKNAWWHPRCLAELGCVAGRRKDYLRAQQLLTEALDLWKQLQHEPFYAWGLAQLGHIKAEHYAEHPTAAMQLYKQGLEIAIMHGQAPTALNIFVGLARLLIAAEERHKAIELLSLALHHPTSYFETKAAARELLAEAGIDPQVVTWNESRQAADWQAVARELIAGAGR